MSPGAVPSVLLRPGLGEPPPEPCVPARPAPTLCPWALGLKGAVALGPRDRVRVAEGTRVPGVCPKLRPSQVSAPRSTRAGGLGSTTGHPLLPAPPQGSGGWRPLLPSRPLPAGPSRSVQALKARRARLDGTSEPQSLPAHPALHGPRAQGTQGHQGRHGGIGRRLRADWLGPRYFVAAAPCALPAAATAAPPPRRCGLSTCAQGGHGSGGGGPPRPLSRSGRTGLGLRGEQLGRERYSVSGYGLGGGGVRPPDKATCPPPVPSTPAQGRVPSVSGVPPA